MSELRKKFTKWYVKRGYNIAMYYDGHSGFSYGPKCPWWVKPFAKYLLSPGVFHYEHAKQCAESLSKGFVKGLRAAGITVDESLSELSGTGRDA